MKKTLIILFIAFVLSGLTACGKEKPGDGEEVHFTDSATQSEQQTETEKETQPQEGQPAESATDTAESQTESESETQPETTSEDSPASNWEGAAGCYYSDNDITLEVVLRGSVDARTYDLIFFANEDGREVEVFSIENASRVEGNELRASKNGIDYLLIYQPDEELPRIRVKRENNAGTADLDGLYTIVMG